MSNFEAYGSLETDASTDEVACRGWATLSAHLTSGSGTFTWEFKGADGVWRTILGQSDHITEETYTTSNMINVFYGAGVRVRGTDSAGSS
ncbi:unnamed protein product, partial [marine sediment metagenome]